MADERQSLSDLKTLTSAAEAAPSAVPEALEAVGIVEVEPKIDPQGRSRPGAGKTPLHGFGSNLALVVSRSTVEKTRSISRGRCFG